MARIIASLLLVGLVATAGCKKDTSADKPASTSQPAASRVLPITKSESTNATCRKLCMVVGKCSFKDGKCYASSSADCQKSFGCKTGGLCNVKDGLCVAVSNADCEKSDLCHTQGRCIVVNGRCENANVPADE